MGLGVQVNVGVMIVVFLAAALFINSVPSAPGAAGSFEFAVIYTLGFFDIGRAEAASIAFLMHAVIFIPPMAIALLVLSREGLEFARSQILGQGTAGDTTSTPEGI